LGHKTITLLVIQLATWLTTNGIAVVLDFSLVLVQHYSGTAGAWAGANLLPATGATSVVGTSGATFYITGVQLEAGSTASPFAHENYSDTLQKCQRYYEIIGRNSGSNGYANIFSTPLAHFWTRVSISQ
jgi:hypothetical protein